MLSSDLSESDEKFSDWGSDDEPPGEKLLDTVVVYPEAHALKYIIDIGEGQEKPGYGDRVTIWWKLLKPDLINEEELLFHNKTPRCITKIQQELEKELVHSGHKVVVELGYNNILPFIVEKTATTMRINERCLIFCQDDNLWTDNFTGGNMKNVERYEIYRKNRQEEYRKFSKLKSQWIAKQKWVDKKHPMSPLALTETRSILYEPLITVSSGNLSPENHDLVYYTYQWTQNDSGASPSYYIGTLTRESVLPTPYAYDVLLRMKRGEKWMVHLRENSVSLPSDKIFWIELHTILTTGTVNVQDYSCRSSTLPVLPLPFMELFPSGIGTTERTTVENGCRLLAVISFRASPNKQYALFRSAQQNDTPAIPATCVCWTVGSGAVPYWLDDVVRGIKHYSRRRVKIPCANEFFKHFTTREALWITFYKKAKGGKEFNDFFSNVDLTKDVFSFSNVYVFNHEDLKASLVGWIDSAPLDEQLQLLTLSSPENACYFIPNPHLDMTRAIQELFKTKFADVALNDSVQHFQSRHMKNMICQQKHLGFWDDQMATHLGTLRDACFVDVQLIEILERMEKSWTFTEDQRFGFGNLWKSFGNFLYNKQLFDLALHYYKEAIEVIRYSPDLDVVQHVSLKETAQELRHPQDKTDIQGSQNEHNPKYPIQQLYEALLLNVVQVYIALTHWNEAIAAAQQCLHLETSSSSSRQKSYYRLALAYFHLGFYRKSRQNIVKCLAYNPKEKAALNLLYQLDTVKRLTQSRQKDMFYNIFLKDKKLSSV